MSSLCPSFSVATNKQVAVIGRSDGIRTHGLLVPNQARYQLRYTRMMKQVESGQPVDMSGSSAPLGSIEHFSYVLGQCIDRYNSVFVE